MNRNLGIFLLLLLLPAKTGLTQEKGTITDNRDGRVYQTVQIGDQTWMAENLAYLPEICPVRDLSWDEDRFWVYGYWGNSLEEARDKESYLEYGVLYNWAAAMNSACPEGWKLPDESDWQKLEKYLGMSESELSMRDWRNSGSPGKKLKTTTHWYQDTGSDEVGFGALPSGLMGYEQFECEGFGAYYWVGTSTHQDNAWIRSLGFNKNGIQRIEERKWFGCSVRCIRVQ